MLFNATHPEELRVAIVDGQKLLDLDIESPHNQLKKGNIYKGQVTRVEPSLEAAFVEYGSERQGFLPLKEISRVYFNDYSPQTPMSQVKIQDVVKEGQELVIQVEKDERGNKGAALTTFISLAGRYLVLMPNNPKGGGISRRIEGEERSQLREAMSALEIPREHALIARTAGIGKDSEDLQWDLDYLLRLWDAISKAAEEQSAPFLVFQETNLVVRSIRDYFRSDISEIIIDDDEIFDRATRFMNQVMPHNLIKLKKHEDTVPLFSRYQIEHQIESAYTREVRLSSGGALVIDHTEALISIDVNSARATKGADIEETALHTNLEAAEEVARQLRIRDLGGLIVIDFIDMIASRNQRAVENRLQEALRADRARVQVGRISRFGLLEMSRQRLRSSISESNYHTCPRCEGNGHIRSVESSALSILRILEEEALKENTEAIVAHLPLKSATYLLNEKRHEVSMIENRLGTSITIVPTNDLDTPHFRVNRLRAEDIIDHPELPSFRKVMMTPEEDEKRSRDPRSSGKKVSRPAADQTPAVGIESITVEKPQKKPVPAAPGLFKRMITSLFGEKETVEDAPARKQESRGRGQKGGQQRRQDGNRGQSRKRQTRGRQRNDRGNKSGDSRQGGNRQAGRDRPQNRQQGADQRSDQRSGRGSSKRSGRRSPKESGQKSDQQSGPQSKQGAGQGQEHGKEQGKGPGQRSDQRADQSAHQRTDQKSDERKPSRRGGRGRGPKQGQRIDQRSDQGMDQRTDQKKDVGQGPNQGPKQGENRDEHQSQQSAEAQGTVASDNARDTGSGSGPAVEENRIHAASTSDAGSAGRQNTAQPVEDASLSESNKGESGPQEDSARSEARQQETPKSRSQQDGSKKPQQPQQPQQIETRSQPGTQALPAARSLPESQTTPPQSPGVTESPDRPGDDPAES